MADKSYGKDFEVDFKKQFEEQLRNSTIIRLYDTTAGFKNVTNPCDFICYDFPNLFMFELKAIKGNRLNFKSHISKNQWEGLLKEGKKFGVYAGILCWFIEKNVIRYYDIVELEYRKINDHKSVTWEWGMNVPATQRRLFFNINMEEFLDAIRKYEEL